MNELRTLEGQKIVLAVTGSIAAVETVRLAHALKRKGAEVQGVMSQAACRIIHPDSLTYATGRPAITSISGMVEHVAFCGDGGWADLLLIAPCTANTLCKIAGGIDDTSVTTFATTAIGRGMPVIISPAMHHSMFRHPGVTGCLSRLQEWGIHLLNPRIEEKKAKIASIDRIVLACERELLGKPLAGKHILITSGPCSEPLDDVRILTTRSTGRMGAALALQAYRLGGEVTIVHNGDIPCARNIRIERASEMRDAVHHICKSGKVDLFIGAAAVSDFTPVRQPGKIPSGNAVTITLQPLPKIISEVAREYSVPAVAFKLGEEGEERARMMLGSGIHLVVANRPEAMGSPDNDVVVSGEDIREEIRGTKEEVAMAIWKIILPRLDSWATNV
ncbi:MAG TPA: bifunctional phosphopantothenoylcysteine decarboxylase/phosphopantothenate--cysteine ligase CoaBC [Methanoregulaceae archaeon]|nr:bifunctional phosphopantothenoylcysteine decarboxylase/phosphopantothenate--cysteine ligase CoaBC [Methanoregulaceae archaeon]